MRNFRRKLGLDYRWAVIVACYVAAAIYGSVHEGLDLVTWALVACGMFLTVLYARSLR